MADNVVAYKRNISSKDFVLELRNLFAKLHDKNLNTPENKFLKPIALNPLQALGLAEISVEDVLANSPIELIKALSPYSDKIDSLNNSLKEQLDKSTEKELTEKTAFEIEKAFLGSLLSTFDTLSTAQLAEEKEIEDNELTSLEKAEKNRNARDKKLAPIKNAINHVFQYVGAKNQPIIDLNKLEINDYKDHAYYSRKFGKNDNSPNQHAKKLDDKSTSAFIINKNSHEEIKAYVRRIASENGGENTGKFPYSFYQSQITRLQNDTIAYYMSQVISFGEGSNAWRGLFLLLSAPGIAALMAAGLQPALVLSLPLLAGYCAQQVNQTLFYVSIKETFNKFSEGLFKKSNGEEITNYWDLALLGGAISLSLCAAFALTAILQFSSTLTLFNLLFSAMPTAISVMLPAILPTILSASIAAFSFVGFASIFSLSFIEKTKAYIEDKKAEDNSQDSIFTQITKLFITASAVTAHAFMCITSVDSLPGIKEYSTLCKSLILIAELPFSTFLYNGISSFVDTIMEYLDSAAKYIDSFINGTEYNEEESKQEQESPVYIEIKENNESVRSTLQYELPVNAFANSTVFGYGIFGTIATFFPTAGLGLTTALSVGGAMAIFSGSFGNNNSAIKDTTETPKPLKFAAA